MIRIIIMRVRLVQIAKELVETFLARHAGGTLITEAPFANQRRMISGLLQHFSDCEIFRSQRDTGLIAADAIMPRVEPRHQRTPGRSADGAARIAIGEPN